MRVITYGTFDLFHEGHRRLLERAKKLGDFLIVGVTTENYDDSRGKLNVRDDLMVRIQNIEATGLADLIIIEEHEGQKITDIQKYDVDIFTVGSDWAGQFDYLRDYCDVIYLERTKGISSTELRTHQEGMLRLGVVGTGRIASRFVKDGRFVAGVSVEAVHSRTPESARKFAEELGLPWVNETYEEMLQHIDAVYIASPHDTHFDYAREALQAGRHVLIEKPMALSVREATELFELANERGLVCMEALKTAFAPAFQRLVAVARSGSIGQIRSVDATFTKLIRHGREREAPDGGSISELASYPLLAIIKLLGTTPENVWTQSFQPADSEVELFSRIDLTFPHAIASARTGIGVKSEGDLVVAGTRGYLYVPAPWWLTDHFETRFEDPRHNRKFYFPFAGEGLRYELAEFASLIRDESTESFRLRQGETVAILRIMEEARANARFFG